MPKFTLGLLAGFLLFASFPNQSIRLAQTIINQLHSRINQSELAQQEVPSCSELTQYNWRTIDILRREGKCK